MEKQSIPTTDDSPRPARAPTAVFAAQALFVFSAFAWLLFAVYTLLGMDSADASQSTTMWMIGVLMLLNTGVMVWVAAGLGKQQRRSYWLAVALLAINLVLTVTDQMGLYDWLILGLDAGILALLLATGKHYKADPVARRNSRS
jgi:hypothetical protein